jgi:hypothetical protein
MCADSSTCRECWIAGKRIEDARRISTMVVRTWWREWVMEGHHETQRLAQAKKAREKVLNER